MRVLQQPRFQGERTPEVGEDAEEEGEQHVGRGPGSEHPRRAGRRRTTRSGVDRSRCGSAPNSDAPQGASEMHETG
jgi:hypothetical protein